MVEAHGLGLIAMSGPMTSSHLRAARAWLGLSPFELAVRCGGKPEVIMAYELELSELAGSTADRAVIDEYLRNAGIIFLYDGERPAGVWQRETVQ
jgi:hypothetical protein